MKFNLKTIKEACRNDEQCWDNSEIWKAVNGFEAELRERMNNTCISSTRDNQRDLCKEILEDVCMKEVK